MKKLLLLIIIVLVVNTSYAQAPCNDETIINVKGSWKKRSDALMKTDNQAIIISHIDAISNLFKTAFPEPRGMEAGWYRTMNGNPPIKNGPLPYEFNSLYLAWYCNQNLHQLLLGDETGTWAYAFVNNFSWFISNQYDLLTIKVNGDNVYLFPPVKGQWKGYPLYQASSHGDKGRCIILTHNDQVPWKPITQGQYLQAVKNLLEKQKQASDDSYTKREENTHKSISDIQGNKYLKQTDKDKIIAGLQKDLDKFQQAKAAMMAKNDKYWNDKISIIDKYSSQNHDLLAQPAIIENRYVNDFSGSFSTLEKGGQMMITVDPAYFNKQLPRYAAQFIVLYWRWDNNAPGLNFKKQFEENFPVDKLNGMLDK